MAMRTTTAGDKPALGSSPALETGSFLRRLGFVDGRDVDTHEPDLAQHVHGRDHRLVRRAPIGTYGDGLVAAGTRDLEDRGTQGVGRGIDELAVVDTVAAALRHRDHDRIALLLAGGCEAGLRQFDLQPPFLHEGRRQHEEDDQQQGNVDQRDQVDLRIVLQLWAPQFHAVRAMLPSASPAWGSAPSESAKFTAIFSISTTMRSTLPRR